MKTPSERLASIDQHHADRLALVRTGIASLTDRVSALESAVAGLTSKLLLPAPVEQSPEITFEHPQILLKKIATFCRTTEDEIRHGPRRQNIAKARALFSAVMRRAGATFAEIGAHVGLDHSSVISAVSRLEAVHMILTHGEKGLDVLLQHGYKADTKARPRGLHVEENDDEGTETADSAP